MPNIVPQRPTITAIVPARNEAACIATVVQGLLAQRDAQGAALLNEVLVADNGSTDGTGDIARQCGSRGNCPDYRASVCRAVRRRDPGGIVSSI